VPMTDTYFLYINQVACHIIRRGAFGEWGGSYIAADQTLGLWGGVWRCVCVGVLGRDPNRQRRTIQKTVNRIGYCLASSLVSGRYYFKRIRVRRTVAVGVRLTIADRALACALPRSLTYRRPARPLFRIRSRAPTCCRLPLLDK